ncbi:hypothetical protein CXF85_09880 [Colwellia sp. 75C3]|uniref:hypothetical protein n=1 Tax=Colwellia sp. 75C3 TaxID=888425 RepID=UPI000C325A4D|nr:hypothetical protein [Colwellia sp. 75C3]PKG83799.1 hypothetical protein CXF85_09880 [Colwellia sp. 75C3]
MTMQIASSGISTSAYTIQPVMPIRPEPKPRPDFSDILTPEQKNTVQHGANDKIAEQVEKVKSNFQTAKDIDLMQSYYQQQQKLFDIYLQTSTDGDTTSSSAQTSENSSAVSALTNTYAELYELHQTVKNGVGSLPSIDNEHGGIATLPANSATNTNEMAKNSSNQSLAHKQVDAYNSLMMPSTASYVHLSA